MGNTILRHVPEPLCYYPQSPTGIQYPSWRGAQAPATGCRECCFFLQPPQLCCLGGLESGLCVGQSCGQHTQAQACQSHGREAHATLAELPPVMVWWERLGSPDCLPISPPPPMPADMSVLELGAQKLWSQRTGTAGPQACIHLMQPWCKCIFPCFREPHAGRGAKWSGVGQGCRAQGAGAQELMHTRFP